MRFSILYIVLVTFTGTFFYSCSKPHKNLNYSQTLDAYRKTYKSSFLNDERSPLNAEDIQYLDFFDPNTQWVLQCTCEIEKNNPIFEIPTYSGIQKPYKVYATVICHYEDKTINLQLYQSAQSMNPMAANLLFLPFKDETNSVTTYGGGRYINQNMSDIKDGTITIDFNKSYNPWCAYSDGYNCPIPPKENHLDLEVNAGEKMYLGPYKTGKK